MIPRMNKKGDVPTILLFIIALVLAVYSLFVFITFDRGFGGNSKLLSDMIIEAEFYKQYAKESAKLIVEQSEGDVGKMADIAAARGEIFEFPGNFFAKMRNKEFQLDNNILRVSGLFVKSERTNEKTGYKNEIKRNFDLCMEFDSNYKYVQDC